VRKNECVAGAETSEDIPSALAKSRPLFQVRLSNEPALPNRCELWSFAEGRWRRASRKRASQLHFHIRQPGLSHAPHVSEAKNQLALGFLKPGKRCFGKGFGLYHAAITWPWKRRPVSLPGPFGNVDGHRDRRARSARFGNEKQLPGFGNVDGHHKECDCQHGVDSCHGRTWGDGLVLCAATATLTAG
jgi:hypothetical protein